MSIILGSKLNDFGQSWSKDDGQIQSDLKLDLRIEFCFNFSQIQNLPQPNIFLNGGNLKYDNIKNKCCFLIPGESLTGDPVRRRLKDGAFPTKFPGLPSYLSIKIPPKRLQSTSFEERQNKKVQEAENQAAEFLESDCVQSFAEISDEKLRFPPSWNIITWKDDKQLVLEEIVFDEDSKPKLGFSLTVFETLQFQLVSEDRFVSTSKVHHIAKKQVIERYSDISNILAFLKSYQESAVTKEDIIDHCIKKLSSALEDCDKNSEISTKLSFISSQLSLLNGPAQSRRYSPSFIWTALSWMKTSPALYRLLLSEGTLTLPSIGYLKQISSSFSLESGLSTGVISYLDTRAKQLTAEQKTVSLILDEVMHESKNT